ncbi:MAG: hypothetical protein QM770_15725 [Tepidisphaeraceae bacterium]
MPLVACDKCGKKLNAKDEWVGKKLKCPACGNTFTVTAGGAGARGPSTPTGRTTATASPVNDAVARAKKRPVAERGAGTAVSLNWGFISMIVVGVIVVILGFLAWWGPIRNNSRWNAQFSQLDTDTRDVIDYCIRKMREKDEPPEIKDDEGNSTGGASRTIGGLMTKRPAVQIHELSYVFKGVMQMSYPEWVPFKGQTSDGPIEGEVNTSNGEVRFTITLGGMTLPSGVQISAGEDRHKLTGRVTDKTARTITGEVDGTPLPK